MRSTKKTKPPRMMTDAELAALAARHDRELVMNEFKPLDAAAKARWRRAKKKRGRPRKGAGVKVISVSIEPSMLRAVDQLAKRKGLSRSGLIASQLLEAIADEAQRRRAS